VGHILAFANQKGGVAKTTTTQAVGVALAQSGHRVLLVDLDPQACLTYAFGLDPDSLAKTVHDALVRREKLDNIVVSLATQPAQDAGAFRESGSEPRGGGRAIWRDGVVLSKRALPGRLDLLPANLDLAGSEVHLLSRTGREHVLARALAPVQGIYDFVMVDCPPSLGVLTINGLTAADRVVVPLQCEALSHRGVGQLLETVEDVRAYAKGHVIVEGVVATMYQARARHAQEMLEEVGRAYGLTVIGPPVPKSIRFAEAPARGQSILEYAPRSDGALAYRAIAGEIASRLSGYPGNASGSLS